MTPTPLELRVRRLRARLALFLAAAGEDAARSRAADAAAQREAMHARRAWVEAHGRELALALARRQQHAEAEQQREQLARAVATLREARAGVMALQRALDDAATRIQVSGVEAARVVQRMRAVHDDAHAAQHDVTVLSQVLRVTQEPLDEAELLAGLRADEHLLREAAHALEKAQRRARVAQWASEA